MRAYDEAIGQVAACCSAIGASFRASPKDDYHLIDVRYRNGVFTLVADPDESYFQAVSARRLSNVEGANITQSEPIVQVEDQLTDVFDDLETANIRIDTLTETSGSDPIEYFDGFRTAKPLYVYEDGFGPQTFDESLAQLNQIGRKVFKTTVERLNIDLDAVEEATGSEDDPRKSYSRAFQ